MQFTGQNKILIINQFQFGYHIDYVQYCKYLKNQLDITYICWDYERKRIEEPGLKIKYISRKGNLLFRNFHFIKTIIKIIEKETFLVIFINYFVGSSFLPLLNWKNKYHLDIRTGSVSPNLISRKIHNLILLCESKRFKSISIISEGLLRKLHISKSALILPLGANPLYKKINLKKELHLLYIGTFTNRHIEDTICGLSLFLKKHPNADVHYQIIGEGSNKEKDKMKSFIINLGLKKNIDILNYLPFNELTPFYSNSNIGVSYIPINDYYNFQPSTKTFEYLMAGLPVIATETFENMRIINNLNGILIKDTPESFATGLEILYNSIQNFNDESIRKSVEDYEWKRIVYKLEEYLHKKFHFMSL